MAKLSGIIKMTGRVGDVSIYKMKGSNDLIVRARGGFSKERVESDKKLVNVRRMNMEWCGVAQMAGVIRRVLIHLSPLSDYNYLGQLNAKAKAIQKLDTAGEYGKRSIMLSEYRSILNGFSFNNNCFFSSVVRTPIRWQLDRQKKQATVEIEDMDCPHRQSGFGSNTHFRFVLELGVVSDLIYLENAGGYVPSDFLNHEQSAVVISEWFNVRDKFASHLFSFCLPDNKIPLQDCSTLLLGIGIEFGNTGKGEVVELSIDSGCAQILGVG